MTHKDNISGNAPLYYLRFNYMNLGDYRAAMAHLESICAFVQESVREGGVFVSIFVLLLYFTGTRQTVNLNPRIKDRGEPDLGPILLLPCCLISRARWLN
jgi:hypothetical protein